MSLILEDYLEDNANPHKIIKKLRIKDLEHAINHGYDFNNIKRGRIPKNMVSNVGFLEPYIGYDCKGVLNNIRLHIEKLQLLPSIHSSKSLKKIDIRKRLINIGKRYLLFTRFIT